MIFPTISDEGYIISLSNDTENFCHGIFCGKHNIQGAVCPNCAKPLLRFFTFNLSNLPITVQSCLPSAHLLYCWRCEINQSPFVYQIIDDNAIEILSYRKGSRIDDFPYKDYPEYFPPSSFEYIALRADEQQILQSINNDDIDIYNYMGGQYAYLNQPQHQIGGMPLLEQAERWTKWINIPCPLCGKYMLYFSIVADLCLDPRGFVMDPFVQVLYRHCNTCNVFNAICLHT